MPPRRPPCQNLLPRHVAQVSDALWQQWWTVKELVIELGLGAHTIEFCLHTIGHQRVVFKREKAYRLYPEARGVRRV